MVDLLPCPFCGGDANLHFSPSGEADITDVAWVECAGCKVEQMELHKTRESAAIAWNRRAVPATQEAVARAIYEDEHGGLKNCWAWDDSGLDDEHPRARDRYLRYARAALAASGHGPTAGWQPIDDNARQIGRCLIAWKAFGGIGPHVELGRFKAGVGWCNTYGHSFHGDPDVYMPLPPIAAAVKP